MKPSEPGQDRQPHSAFRDPAFALFVGSVTLTAIGIWKLATDQGVAALVFCVVAAGLGLLAKAHHRPQGCEGSAPPLTIAVDKDSRSR